MRFDEVKKINATACFPPAGNLFRGDLACGNGGRLPFEEKTTRGEGILAE
jgi:hypothetical protein